jgi:hypothetical protein
VAAAPEAARAVVEIGFADASLVVLAERHRTRDILTWTSVPSAPCARGRKGFRLLPLSSTRAHGEGPGGLGPSLVDHLVADVGGAIGVAASATRTRLARKGDQLPRQEAPPALTVAPRQLGNYGLSGCRINLRSLQTDRCGLLADQRVRYFGAELARGSSRCAS